MRSLYGAIVNYKQKEIMAISIDRVYQKVLAFANKEQRGYITPQEFNLFAHQAQREIFEQYFYDINQWDRGRGNERTYSDPINNLQQKIDVFNVVLWGNNNVKPFNQYGSIRLHDWAPDLYRLGDVRLSHHPEKTKIVEYMGTEKERLLYGNSPLTEPTYDYPIYISYQPAGQTHTIQIFPFPDNYINAPIDPYKPFLDTVSFSYIRTPKTPTWGYVVVNDKALHNSTTSQNFELHPSEESELVYRILAFVGIAIEKPQLTQIAAGLEQAKVQQEKQ